MAIQAGGLKKTNNNNINARKNKIKIKIKIMQYNDDDQIRYVFDSVIGTS